MCLVSQWSFGIRIQMPVSHWKHINYFFLFYVFNRLKISAKRLVIQFKICNNKFNSFPTWPSSELCYAMPVGRPLWYASQLEIEIILFGLIFCQETAWSNFLILSDLSKTISETEQPRISYICLYSLRITAYTKYFMLSL